MSACIFPYDLTEVSPWVRIVEFAYSENNFVQLNVFNDNEIQLSVKDDGTGRSAGVTSALSAGKWYHLVGVWDASANSLALYVDGVLQSGAGDTAAGWGGTQSGYVGKRGDGGFFKGAITEVAVFNDAFTLTKVQELYNDGEALDATLHSSVANLSGYWRNRGAGTWTDLSTNSNNGTPTSVTEHLILPEGQNSRDTQGFLMDRTRTSGINMPSQLNIDAGYIDAGALTLSASDSFTLSWWIKPYDLSDNYMFGTAGNDYISLIGASNIRFNPSNASHVTLVPSTAILVDEWLHLTITRIADGKTNLFVNGVDQNTEATLNEPFEFRYIGGISIRNFKGAMDDVALYNGTALTAAQILRNYKAGKRRHRN